MTSPLHGEDRRFEFGRAHGFFFQSDARIKAEAEDDEDDELCNFKKKLCNFDPARGEQSVAALMTDQQYDEDNDMHSSMDDEIPYDPLYDPEALDPEDEDYHYHKLLAEDLHKARRHRQKLEALRPSPAPQDRVQDARLALSFTSDELEDFVSLRLNGLAEKSHDWIRRSSDALWERTHGEISSDILIALRDGVIKQYNSESSHSKVFSFIKAFLKFLATTRSEPLYQTFAPYLELPKTVKERKSVTSRIVTKEDISNVLQHIEKAEREGRISPARSAQYSAFILFGAYTGQRSEATVAKLTVGQFRTALALNKPVLEVGSSQDKERMSHYVPLHPHVVKALEPLLAGRTDDELMFTHSSFLQWIKRQKIPMSRFPKPFVLGDLRKFAEQYGDVIEWDQSNRAYILTHDVSSVSWSHYRNPLPENVYDIYMKYWENVDFSI